MPDEVPLDTQIAQKILNNLDVLVQSKRIEELAQKGDVFVNSEVCPALFLIMGDEFPTPNEIEDNVGYQLSMLAQLKLQIEDFSNMPEEASKLAAEVIKIMESDLQLGGLVKWIEYQGNVKYISELKAPAGGILLTYKIDFRRPRGVTGSGY